MTKTLASLTERIEGKKTILNNLMQRQTSLENQMKLCLAKLEQAGLPTNQPFEQLGIYLSGFDDKISQLRAEQKPLHGAICRTRKEPPH